MGETGGDGKAIAGAVGLKVHLCCRGCTSKVLKYVRGFQGVADVKVAKEDELRVEGKFDAARLLEMLQVRTKKKVEVVPGPSTKHQQQHQKKKKAMENDEKSNDSMSKKKSEETKQLPVVTVVFKLGGLDCQGCIAKINRTIRKTAGVHSFTMDKHKELLTVRGAVDAKALANKLKEKTRKSAEIVPQKKEKESKKNGGGGPQGEENNAAKFDSGRMEYYGPPQPQTGYSYGELVHAPQLFSDENPNACSVM